MGTHMHPMEGVILDLTVVRNQVETEFNRDGVISSDERAALNEYDSMASTIKHVRSVERAADLYVRQGPKGLTDYGKQLWSLAGLEVEPWDPEAA